MVTFTEGWEALGGEVQGFEAEQAPPGPDRAKIKKAVLADIQRANAFFEA